MVSPGNTPGGPDVSATLTKKSDAAILFAVNDTLKDMARPVDFSAFGYRGQEVCIWTLADRKHAGEPDVTNNFSDPERISPVKSMIQAASPCFDYRFPALSLTVIRWQIEPKQK
jgi:alpha-L-arabinofuranosidase